MDRNDEPRAPVEGATLRPMAEAHLDQILGLERESFASPWARHHFQHELRENRLARNWVIQRGDDVLGYASVWHIDAELRINTIAIHPRQRRRGLAAWLLQQLLDRATHERCTTATLEVRPSNRAARALYASFGFVEVARRKNYYALENEDALILLLHLG